MQSREEKLAKKREWYQRNKQKISERAKLPENLAHKRAIAARNRERNRDKKREQDLRYYHANREAILEKHREYYQKNKVWRDSVNRQWCLENIERRRSHVREYDRKHLAEKQARLAKRRAQKELAVPAWADFSAIKAVYLLRPDGYAVDHIYPILGSWVCGLHVESNLQYLTGSENSSKGNRRAEKYHFERKVEHPKYPCVTGLIHLTHE